ncbi:hypothetical protein PYCCODRAFT_1465895 [Trametes coccinea BRFM310]|uniref:Uncharacterized protein n=1 Tax=Trametes coccinea (strain BRFM310) TaxID=1353009 RepID=A0A1Y2ITN1_TRAC3|nr:hypothetical protein PYCCODRAFT_1465895 [Trametes coccinea BRFM310]
MSGRTPRPLERQSETHRSTSPTTTTSLAGQDTGISSSLISEIEEFATHAEAAWRISRLEETPLPRPPAVEPDVQRAEPEVPLAGPDSSVASVTHEESEPSGAARSPSGSVTSSYLPTPRSDSGRLPRLSLALSEPVPRVERTPSPTPGRHFSPAESSPLLRFPSDPSIASDIVISSNHSDGSLSMVSSPEILSPGSVFSDFTVVAEDEDDIFLSPRSEPLSPRGWVALGEP